MIFPFKDKQSCRVTCEYGRAGGWSSGKHDGIDLVSDGDRTLLAVAEGRVIRSGWNDSWGNYTVVEMRNGQALVYAHMTACVVVKGQTVKAGDKLGVMGNTGHSTGAHLHIELQTDYYKAGRTGDIAALLGIENKVGKVKEVGKMENVPDWQIVAIKEVCAKYGMDEALWLSQAEQPVTVGELFGVLNKAIIL